MRHLDIPLEVGALPPILIALFLEPLEVHLQPLILRLLLSQLFLLASDFSHELLDLLIESLLVAHVGRLVLEDLLGLGLDPLRLPDCLLFGTLGLSQLALQTRDLVMRQVLAHLHLIVPTFLELLNDLVELADLGGEDLVPSHKLFHKFLQVHPVDIGGVLGLAHAYEFTDLLHLLRQPLVFLVDKVILLSKLGDRVLSLCAVIVELDLVKVLSTPVELAKAGDLLIPH